MFSIRLPRAGVVAMPVDFAPLEVLFRISSAMRSLLVHVAPSGGFWGGVGEPTIFVAAPAVLNAIFAATGQRIRSFPLKNHNMRLA